MLKIVYRDGKKKGYFHGFLGKSNGPISVYYCGCDLCIAIVEGESSFHEFLDKRNRRISVYYCGCDLRIAIVGEGRYFMGS